MRDGSLLVGADADEDEESLIYITGKAGEDGSFPCLQWAQHVLRMV